MKNKTLTISSTTVQTDCSILVMCIRGKLDGQNYTQLISLAQTLYDKNHRKLILDLTEVQTISMAGLFALHSVAAIFNGQEPLDPEGGWQALRTMKHGLNNELQTHFKLSSPQPQVRSALARSGFDTFIAVFDNLFGAIESFSASPVEEIESPKQNLVAHLQRENSPVMAHHHG